MFVRRGMHLNAYNAYQSIIRGGHIFLTIRISDQPIHTHGDKLELIVALNQDTMDRHLGLLGKGAVMIYNSDSIKPGTPNASAQLCALPVKELMQGKVNKLAQNTMALGVIVYLLGVDFTDLEKALKLQFQRKGDSVVEENVTVARAG